MSARPLWRPVAHTPAATANAVDAAAAAAGGDDGVVAAGLPAIAA